MSKGAGSMDECLFLSCVIYVINSTVCNYQCIFNTYLEYLQLHTVPHFYVVYIEAVCKSYKIRVCSDVVKFNR